MVTGARELRLVNDTAVAVKDHRRIPLDRPPPPPPPPPRAEETPKRRPIPRRCRRFPYHLPSALPSLEIKRLWSIIANQEDLIEYPFDIFHHPTLGPRLERYWVTAVVTEFYRVFTEFYWGWCRSGSSSDPWLLGNAFQSFMEAVQIEFLLESSNLPTVSQGLPMREFKVQFQTKNKKLKSGRSNVQYVRWR